MIHELRLCVVLAFTALLRIDDAVKEGIIVVIVLDSALGGAQLKE